MNGGFNVYTSINTLNAVLEILPTASVSEDTRKLYAGQAKFLRAFFYFNLVQTYGAVPLHTSFIGEASQADDKATVAEIYDQIITDLTEASTELSVIPPANATTDNPFGGKAAGQGAACIYWESLSHPWMAHRFEHRFSGSLQHPDEPDHEQSNLRVRSLAGLRRCVQARKRLWQGKHFRK